MIAAVFGFAVWLLIDTAVVAFVLAAWDAGRAGECSGSSSRVEGGQVMKVGKIILLSWFFLTFWQGRVTELEFKGKDACMFARPAAVRVLGEENVGSCWEDK
jgi:hypothetical protein